MPASSEFITLCQSQVALLIDNFGASLSAIYLTEDPTASSSETALIPLVMYPEGKGHWPEVIPLALSAAVGSRSMLAKQPRVLGPASLPESVPSAQFQPSSPSKPESSPTMINPLTVFADGPEPTRMVLPLVHEEMMWGLMVVGRTERHWSQREQSQLEQVAHTLAIACVLDQRSQWLAQTHEQQRLLQSQQHTNLSTLLHQFRNPLTTLRTLGKLLLKRMKSNDANYDVAESIIDESTHLEQLLRKFDHAIDLGEAELETELEEKEVILPQRPALLPSAHWLTDGAMVLQPCWLSDILEPLLHSMAGRLDEQQLHLVIEIPDPLPPVKADATALREVLGNLIDNALKYTPAGGHIWVTVQRQGDVGRQVFSISDSGPGIPSTDLDRIFERHYRGVQAQTDIAGTGLGLAIAQDLVVQMQGTLQVISPALIQTPGQTEPGSTFQVTLSEMD